LKEFDAFPECAKSICLATLTIAARGGKADLVEPLDMGPAFFALNLVFEGGAFLVMYAVKPVRDIYIQDVYIPVVKELDLVRGSGNVFRDLGRKNADAEQLKAIPAAEIIKALDRERLTVRAAHRRTGIPAADFSRIRNANLGGFTVDRLITILNRLGSRVAVSVRVHGVEAPGTNETA